MQCPGLKPFLEGLHRCGGQGEDLSAGLCDSDGVFCVGGSATGGAAQCPPINGVSDQFVGVSHHPGFYGKHEPWTQLVATPALPIISHVWVLVHGATNPMPANSVLIR